MRVRWHCNRAFYQLRRTYSSVQKGELVQLLFLYNLLIFKYLLVEIKANRRCHYTFILYVFALLHSSAFEFNLQVVGVVVVVVAPLYIPTLVSRPYVCLACSTWRFFFPNPH